MLTRIATFELRLQLRSPLFFIGFLLFFLLTFASVTLDGIQIGDRGNVHVNSPYAILQTLAVMNLFAIFVVTAFVANVVIRDDETGFAPIIRTTRVSKLDYLVGRFVGAIVAAFLLLTGVPLAILIGSWMPWIDPEKLGPFVPGHYLYALFFYGVPTLVVMSSGFFALATLTRSMLWTYVGVIAFLVLFILSGELLKDPAYDTFSALIDPFGLGALGQATKYWTAADRNTMLPPVTGLILQNRALWLGVGLVLFLIAYARFRFEAKDARPRVRKKEKPAPAEAPHGPRARHSARHSGRHSGALHAASGWEQFLALTRFDMRFVFESPAFFVLLAIGIINAYGGLVGAVEQSGSQSFPVTRLLVDALRGAFTLIPIIIAIYYSGELVWRDRERRIHEIVDATAAPDWAFMLPKVFAIALVLLSTNAVGALTGALFQLFHGYYRLEPLGYLLWFVLPGFIAAVILAALAVFVQALVPHKVVGWAVMLVYVVSTVTLHNVGFEHNLYTYGGAPPVPLSDMNGMGRFWVGRAWFNAYWLTFAFLLLVFAHLLWRRGAEPRLRPRLMRLGRRLRGTPGWLIAGAAVLWLGLGCFIFYNTNVLNEYRTSREEERHLADYERELLGFEKIPQPRIVEVKLAVDIQPNAPRALTVGSYVIENRTPAPLTHVHVRWSKSLCMDRLEVEGASLEREYAGFEYRIYAFQTPLQPGERRLLSFSTRLEQRGFPNGAPLTRIVDNGTFLDNFEIAPILGMDRSMLIRDRNKRRKQGLPSELRPPKLEDEAATANHYLRHDSDWVTAELSVTTDADQTPLAPGYAVSDTTTGDRRTLITRTEAPIHNFFSIQSARYAIEKDSWVGRDGKTVDLSVYYHPQHVYNVRRMLTAMKASLDVFTERFSPFQFRQARILEFPAYEDFAQSFANTVPYSEAIGFIQDFDERESAEKIDFVTFVTAHEIGHQWWAHQVIGADKQGMTMLSESFAQYSALLVMEQMYGKEQIRKFLKRSLDHYLRSRGGEVVEELPLVRVEDQPYIHYEKGGLVMYWLKEVVGEDVVDRALSKLLARYAFKAAPYPSASDFVTLLRQEAGPEHAQLITDLFENITLYDMKASDAKVRAVPGGKYVVSFDVQGKKLYADGIGKETEAPLNEVFNVGAFSEEPGKKHYTRESVLAFERRSLQTGKQQVTLLVDRLPHFVGVDPFNERIDRNADDNLSEVPAP
jgi:ABC-2 type transport system permease protein